MEEKMGYFKNQMTNVGVWFAADPRRIVWLLAALILIATLCTIAISTTITHPYELLLIAENSPGGS